jgi:hypothetical protein
MVEKIISRFFQYTAIAVVIGSLGACGGENGDRLQASSSDIKYASGESITAISTADYTTVVQQLYIAYFGRAADPNGIAYFASRLHTSGAATTLLELAEQYESNQTVKELVDAFGTSQESSLLYTGQTDEFINAIFRNILGRDVRAEGLIFWRSAIDEGKTSRGRAAMSIAIGALHNKSAQGLIDAEVISKKTEVATHFTNNLDTASEIMCYVGSGPASAVRTMLSQVNFSTDTIAFQKNITETIDSMCQQSQTFF